MSLVSRLKTVGFTAVGTLMPFMALAQLKPENGIAVANGGDLLGTVRRVVNMFLMVVALIAVIMLIIGGFRYIISQGESDQAEQAKNTILYAVIGLIVIGLSAAIVNFVVNIVGSA